MVQCKHDKTEYDANMMSPFQLSSSMCVLYFRTKISRDFQIQLFIPIFSERTQGFETGTQCLRDFVHVGSPSFCTRVQRLLPRASHHEVCLFRSLPARQLISRSSGVSERRHSLGQPDPLTYCTSFVVSLRFNLNFIEGSNYSKSAEIFKILLYRHLTMKIIIINS